MFMLLQASLKAFQKLIVNLFLGSCLSIYQFVCLFTKSFIGCFVGMQNLHIFEAFNWVSFDISTPVKPKSRQCPFVILIPAPSCPLS